MPDRLLASHAVESGASGPSTGKGLLFRLRSFAIGCLVYLDAFRAAPKSFLTATKWRVLGKRVRARGQFAPLLSLSPRAYRLWMLRSEYRGAAGNMPGGTAPLIVPLVDATGNPEPASLERTLACLRSLGASHIVIDGVAWDTIASQIAWEQQPWLMPMVAGDVLAPSAMAAYCSAIAQGGRDVIYADDDLLGRRNARRDPHFKPAWNGPLFEHYDFLAGACIVRAKATDVAGLPMAPAWPEALVRRVVARSSAEPLHVAAVLHHRRERPLPRLPAKPLTLLSQLPSMSVIIPTRNRVDLLRTCIEGLARTHYPDLEVIVADNDSDDPETLAYLAQLDPARHRVLHHPGPFNYSAINNRAVEHAKGTLICLLNNDIEVLDPDWLAIMATSAVRPDVGAVGARLLYPDGRIQHAGVVMGVGGAAGHAHRFVHPQEIGYFCRHNLPQFASAVTAACLVVMRERFMAVGMLDESNFPVAFNDVDLCLRLNAKGWQSFYEPRATLVHHESVSRGNDQDPVGAARFAGELAALKRRWGTDTLVDPFHHPHLSRASERFVIAV